MVDLNEHVERSRRVRLCGIIGCQNNNKIQCSKCLN